MVRIEKIVVMLINLEARRASPPYFSAIMAVLTAAGMAVIITHICITSLGRGSRLKARIPARALQPASWRCPDTVPCP